METAKEEHKANVSNGTAISTKEDLNGSASLRDVSFILPLKDCIRDLKSLLESFDRPHAVISHLETRKHLKNEKSLESETLDLYARVKLASEDLDNMTQSLRKISPNLIAHPEDPANGDYFFHLDGLTRIPWFPRHISELDRVSNNVFMYGKDLDADHPGFKDKEYRKRREMFADIAYNYRYGQPIPKIEYTETEKKTWGCVFRELTKLYETHACRAHRENLKLLEKFAGYKESDLPQLEDVSNFLRERTGFTVRPVAGYLSARDFLSGLAFRVFYCTQYIRHSKDPMYTPEPDCCHELLGHMPMLADPTFAQFSHEIGLASLGTSDSEVKKLATCYFFSIEFGLCREEGQLRAYGAGLLSSIAELKHALSDKAKVRPFVPLEVMKEECLVTTFQNGYFETSTFEDATEKMREFAKSIDRPFDVTYDPYTKSIQVVDCLEKVSKLVSDLDIKVRFIGRALEKIGNSQHSWIGKMTESSQKKQEIFH
ncbi:unnamed protein product [Calicophoron daubneyi]|uniref:Biopterin-dependent aromatic amino acid hydroxylase family profile domain-containing protein n=1 Tax=Calicophoron daubneyi TaxID=300641 RepID=A0AAV2TKG5_CALDB